MEAKPAHPTPNAESRASNTITLRKKEGEAREPLNGRVFGDGSSTAPSRTASVVTVINKMTNGAVSKPSGRVPGIVRAHTRVCVP